MARHDIEGKFSKPLTISNHDRDASAMRYVYPVVSRRAGGLSVGINLNVNNACNWSCVYCQVPDLIRGAPPPVDLDVLKLELTQLLDDVLEGDFLALRAPEGMRCLVDVAFSGNGEPTSSDEFPAVVDIVVSLLEKKGLAGTLPIRVISNGSLVHRPTVIKAFLRLREFAGEIWFKIDRATEEGLLAVNQTAISLNHVQRGLSAAADACPVWIQTCWFGMDGKVPSDAETNAYLSFVQKNRDIIRGVHLYGIARPSMQPQRDRLFRLPVEALTSLAARLNAIGVTATVSE